MHDALRARLPVRDMLRALTSVCARASKGESSETVCSSMLYTCMAPHLEDGEHAKRTEDACNGNHHLEGRDERSVTLGCFRGHSVLKEGIMFAGSRHRKE